jgi:hypothetical protein
MYIDGEKENKRAYIQGTKEHQQQRKQNKRDP